MGLDAVWSGQAGPQPLCLCFCGVCATVDDFAWLQNGSAGGVGFLHREPVIVYLR